MRIWRCSTQLWNSLFLRKEFSAIFQKISRNPLKKGTLSCKMYGSFYAITFYVPLGHII